MGIGHSFSAPVLATVALANPRLFSSLVFIDPVLELTRDHPRERYTTPTWLSARRRDQWPSLEAAAETFAKSPLHKTWDPRVLDKWMQHGFVAKPDRKDGDLDVVLATTKDQEVFIYQRPAFHAFGPGGTELLDRDAVPDMDLATGENAEKNPVYRPEMPITFNRLPELRPDVLYIFGGKSYVSQELQREEKLNLTGSGRGGSGGRKAGRVSGVVGKKYGHAIPFQSPAFCADAVAASAVKTLEQWRKEEDVYEAWTKKSLLEKSTISKEFLAALKPPKPKSKI